MLPNGEEIACINPAEALLLYEDIYRDQSYLRGDIRVRDGDIVFDVGANIGLFTLFATGLARNLELYVFEPIPAIFEVLRANLNARGIRAQLFQCGIAARSCVEQFAFYERNSAMSGKYWNRAEERHTARTILLNKHPELAEFLEEILETAFEPIVVDCPLRTLSEIIAERSVPRIDLLKIDVEKSEYDVLCGIEESHWDLIRQVAMEVHDIDGRICAVNQLLVGHGFRTTTVQGRYFKDTGLYDIFARRANDQASPG